MAKKYLTLEEAAGLSGISADELKRLREQGDLRGFADRGAWKFKQEDVEELMRRRQTDSDPDVRIFDDEAEEGSSRVAEGSSVIEGEGGSSVIGQDIVSEQPTVIRGSALDDDEPLGGGASDSDVRLILDDSMKAGSDPDVSAKRRKDSDSDVQLIGDSGPSLEAQDEGSDSDVKLVGTDPEIPLLDDEEQGSDSDVRLVPQPSQRRDASESDIHLAAADREGSNVNLGDEGAGSSIVLAGESGISLENLADSGIALESAESGISLGSLADSGISLADDDDDSITLAKPSNKAGRKTNIPSTKKVLDDDLDDTRLEVPSAEDSEFELANEDEGETSVILFDDDDVDQHSATVVKKSRRGDPDLDETFDLESATGEFDAADDFEEEVVVGEDIVGEDDELDFVEAGDEDFSDEFVAGESQAEFVAPGARMVPAVEQDWGTATFVGLSVATALMAVCGIVMFDLVRSMWAWGEPSGFNSALLDTLRGFF